MPETAPRPDMLAAALDYAAKGWPVFPVDPGDKQPLLGPLEDEDRNPIAGSGGLHRASTDEAAIRGWWKRWPSAMIGLPTGPAIGAFVVDLDAGVDEKTGEIFEAGELLAKLEAELGVPIPATLTVETPRGGRHLYFPWPAGPSVRNRQAIIPRVDVRGEGGYVIGPPSERPDGRAYRWLGDRQAIPPAPPAELLDLVTRRGRWSREAEPPAKAGPAPDEALRKYAFAALDSVVRTLAGAAEGTRNQAINDAAFALGQLVGAGALSEGIARAALREVVAAWPNRRKSEGTIESGLRAGIGNPRDLSMVGARPGTHRGARLAPPEERPDFQVIPGGIKGNSKGTGTRARPRLRKIASTDQLELREVLRQQRRRFDPPPLQPRNGVKAGNWTADPELGLPVEDPCPVTPLGVQGRHYFVLDSKGQFTDVTATMMTHAGIQDLFADTPNWPEWAWPRYGKMREIKNADGSQSEIIPIESFKDDAVRKALFQACARRGLFSAEHKIRGRGAWKLRDGAIYYHAGEEIWIVEGQAIRAIETGIVYDANAELVFPRMEPLPPPWPKPVTPAENPARELLAGLAKWNWERPDVDPILLLGWIGVAFLGGALDWRSAVFLIGDKGTGKSTLQGILKDIFGDALLDSANTTAAGIYQALKHDSRPVAVDEIEGGADNRKVQAVIELARQASSGAFGRRGASDARAQGVEFQMRSAFLFSAINNPPLAPQDLSRIAILRLRELDPAIAGPPPAINIDTCGRMVLARLMLEWHRFPATYKAYREALAAGGHSGRGQDTYGTLLAAADLIVGAELAEELGLPLGEDISAWSKLLHVSTLPEVGDALPNSTACTNYLFQSRVDAWRSGSRSTIGQLIEDLRDQYADLTFNQAKRLLADAGLGLLNTRKYGLLLAVPNSSPQVERLFFGSRWQGVPGIGGWSEALRQAPADLVIRDRELNRVRINNVQQRCMLIALDRLAAADVPAPFTDDSDATVPP